MRENPDLANEIEKQIKEKLGIGPVLDAEVAAPPSNGNGNGNGNGSAGRGNGSGPRAAAVAPAVTV